MLVLVTESSIHTVKCRTMIRWSSYLERSDRCPSHQEIESVKGVRDPDHINHMDQVLQETLEQLEIV